MLVDAVDPELVIRLAASDDMAGDGEQRMRDDVAVGHQILVTACYLLRRQEDYSEAAPAALDERRRIQARLRAVQQLRQLGFEVTLTPSEAAA